MIINSTAKNMPTPTLPPLPRDIAPNLVMRRARAEDIAALVDFQSRVHSDAGWNTPDPAVAALVSDLLEGPVRHPGVTPESFTVVEDTQDGSLVSAVEIVSQTWNYGGIPFDVGRLELIGTHPAYRNQGLARQQIEEQHRWSQAAGHHAQVIVGIPYFYRQFGYEMAMPVGGGRNGFEPNVPVLSENEIELFAVRDAVENDLPFIASLYNRAANRAPIWGVRSMDEWRYELNGRRGLNANRKGLRVIVTNDHEERVGYLVVPPGIVMPGISMPGMVTPGLGGSQQIPIRYLALGYELSPGHTWYEVTPSVIRWLWAEGQRLAESSGGRMASFGLHLGVEHPAYEIVESRLPVKQEPHAFYVRVPNLPGFLNHISQVLDERLAASSMAGYTGELKISFYQSGITLSFLRGKLTARPYIPSPKTWTVAAFPGLSFLQLVFGYRSMEELIAASPDAHVDSDESRAILRALFPKKATNIWSLD